jgi:phosphopantetheine--protein transferase-like protein
MAGEDLIDEAAAFVGKLLDRPVTRDEPLPLRSVQRAAVAAWAKRAGAPLRRELLEGSRPVSLAQLLGDAGAAPAPASTAPPAAPAACGSVAPGGLPSVGLDLESIEALPDAEDFREHPFYRDNFTPAEIAHCLRQADVKASLCGVWAAKEAVLKAGAAASRGASLGHIEIGRDAAGRPTYPGCALSVSHTAQAAAAVCLFASAPPAAATSLKHTPHVHPAPKPKGKLKALALAGTATVAAVAATLLALLHA